MVINDFILKFAEIFDDTDPAQITPDTVFRDLDEWSSLSTLAVIVMADEEFGCELDQAQLHNATTVQDLYDVIVKK